MLMSNEGKGGAGEDGGGEEKVKVQETTFSPHTRTYTPLTTPQISRFRPSASAPSSWEARWGGDIPDAPDILRQLLFRDAPVLCGTQIFSK